MNLVMTAVSLPGSECSIFVMALQMMNQASKSVTSTRRRRLLHRVFQQ